MHIAAFSALFFFLINPCCGHAAESDNAYQGEYGAKTSSQEAEPVTLIDEKAIEAFYTQRGGEPYWLDGLRLNTKASAFLKELQASWTHGLNPDSYRLAAITAVTGPDIRPRMRLSLEPSAVMTFELMLTDAFMRYAVDMSGARVNLTSMTMSPAHWRQPIKPAEALALLEGEEERIEAILAKISPQGSTYKALQAELVTLIGKYKNNPEEKFERIDIANSLFPGRPHKEVSKLRRRLGVGAPPSGTQPAEVYDASLVEAVKHFQAQKGLKPDGIIGTKTLYILNQGIEEKIIQLALNLERLRWMPAESVSKVVMVNLPSATLWALEKGKPVLEMPVIVGRPKRPTLSFRTQITGVRFNPTWTVPPTIQKEDILPKLIEDPGILVDKGLEIYSGYGADAQTIDPMTVDWAAITPSEYRTLRLVQVAGANNPLGRIRILMPNAHDIYLHDTNDHKLFTRSDRAQSSGCVRVQEPEKLASFVLGGKGLEGVQKYLKDSKTRDIMITEKIPVYMLYNTAWVGPDGQVVFGEDIYGKDRELLSILKRQKAPVSPSIFAAYANNDKPD